VGGGNGFSGLHGQPEVCVGDVVVAAGGGGGAGFVAAGGGVVVFFTGTWVLGAELELDGALLSGVELAGELEVDPGVELIQLDAGARRSGSSSAAPWNAMPTSTPSNADPSTAEPPAAHSARTAVLL